MTDAPRRPRILPVDDTDADANAARVWQTTFDAIQAGVAVLDGEARVLRANRVMAALLGVAPDAVLQRPGLPPLPGAVEPAGGWPFDRCRASLRRESAELRVGERWYEVQAHPVLGEDGTFAGAVQTVTEITARRQADEERNDLLARERRARSEAERADRLKDDFLATLSHELRTPLSAIVGWANVLRAAQPSPEVLARGLESIDRNARLQTQLIDDILDMSRMVAGGMTLQLTEVSLADVIAAAVNVVSPSAEARQVSIGTEVGEVAPLRADPARLHQVIWNLLSNAVKFSTPGSRVTVRAVDEPGRVRIEVTDTGLGIGPEFLPHVFEPFRQRDGSITRAHGGLGLGLALVRHLVEMHGGSVQAASEGEGRGATITILLRRREAWSPGASDPFPPLSSLAGTPRLDRVAVLVVEDDTDTRELIAEVLAARGARVDVAASAPEAERLFAARRPDVVLSDIGLPGQDGFVVVRAIRARSAEDGGLVPVLALTAFAREEDRTRVLQAGFQAHVAKPVEPADLVRMVAKWAGAVRLAP